MTVSEAESSRSPLADLLLYLRVGTTGWIVLYLAGCLLLSITASTLTLHLMLVGLTVCLLTYARLPPPNPVLVREVLGPDLVTLPPAEGDWEIAHRAAALDAPENSLEAVRLAAANGATWVEFDVSFTSDMTAVAFHDDSLDRVTEASGLVNQTSYSALSKLDLAPRHPLSASYHGVNIPRVGEFVAECLRLDLKLIMDLKSYEIPEETVSLVLGLYRDYPALRTRAMVTSFFPQLLYRLRSQDPDIVVSISTRPHFLGFSTYEGSDHDMRPRFSGLQQVAARVTDLVYSWMLPEVVWFVVGLSAVLVHRAVVTRQFVASWKAKGVRVMAWTVNNPLEKAYFRHVLGVQVLTDTLERVPPEKLLVDHWSQ